MRDGSNELAVYPPGADPGAAPAASVTLVDYPSQGPVFSGPHQYPFLCKTEDNRLGQPIVDNGGSDGGEGYPVFATDASGAKTTQVVGYSRDCTARDRTDYWYKSTDSIPGKDVFKPMPADRSKPTDLAQTVLLDGRTVEYIIRWERGTIDRFAFSIAMLAPFGEDAAHQDDSLWNRRLTFSFDGGVGIGHTQGTLSLGNSFQQSLGLGYAVISSTGTRTSVHYNLQLGGEDALMVKEEFIERHGVPRYTIGVGGSGGAIQQYIYGQDYKGLIDAAVPQYSYPDMVTQTIHVGDCELLEYFMDVTDKANPKWDDVRNREALEGLHATDYPQNMSPQKTQQWKQILTTYPYVGARSYAAALAAGKLPLGECREGWFGLLPLAMNPTYSGTNDPGWTLMKPDGVKNTVKWTHFDDLRNVYGVGSDGFALRTWDNVGVQYGLTALKSGTITPEEFLKLNATIGGWVNSGAMKPEAAPFGSAAGFDPWSSRNITLSPDGGVTLGARTEGDVGAMNAAYQKGIVFTGHIDIPVIDWRHYREEDLNMHNSHQSFASRERMILAKGNADNQIIWFTDGRPTSTFDQTPQAFAVMDQWMTNIRQHPDRTVAQNKSAGAVDSCFDYTGKQIAAGNGVWNGILDSKPAGACTQAFQLHSTSRIVAGGPIQGGVIKCALQAVDSAIDSGLYGDWAPTTDQRARLSAIFPTGVCDYSKPDMGNPTP